jgi:hypothetical protein
VSVDIDVAPLRPVSITWAALRRSWSERLGTDATLLLGSPPRLRRIGADAIVADDETLTPSSPMYFELATPNTLSVTVTLNKDSLDEFKYLCDYARNVADQDIAILVEAWQKVGWTCGLTSLGGRSSREPTLLRSLACAVADLCDGRIILMHRDIFDLDVGVYTAQQFAASRWRMGM